MTNYADTQNHTVRIQAKEKIGRLHQWNYRARQYYLENVWQAKYREQFAIVPALHSGVLLCKYTLLRWKWCGFHMETEHEGDEGLSNIRLWVHSNFLNFISVCRLQTKVKAEKNFFLKDIKDSSLVILSFNTLYCFFCFICVLKIYLYKKMPRKLCIRRPLLDFWTTAFKNKSFRTPKNEQYYKYENSGQ